jgi:DivIVA domain-containing protein
LEQDSLERIRSATFTISRKGYDKREVERFLTKLADWLEAGGGDQARGDLVKRELERVGEKTARILSEAEVSAEEIRTEAQQEASDTVDRAREQAAGTKQSADEYAARTRKAADDYGEKTRREAELRAQELVAQATQQARQTIDDAQSKARRIVEEGAQRRGDIEVVISDLVHRRDAVLAGVEQLNSELEATVSGHTPRPGSDEFARPAEFDPAVRKGEERRVARHGQRSESASRPPEKGARGAGGPAASRSRPD